MAREEGESRKKLNQYAALPTGSGTHENVLNYGRAFGQGCQEKCSVGQRFAPWKTNFPGDLLYRLNNAFIYCSISQHISVVEHSRMSSTSIVAESGRSWRAPLELIHEQNDE
jgi:hypothetical protein